MKNTVCNVCEHPGTLKTARDVATVPCCIAKFRDTTFTVWRCTNCGSLHSADETDLPLYYEHYPFKQHQLDFHTKLGYKNRLRMLVARGMRSNHRILDFGCGAGLFVEFLRMNGFTQVSGYDAFVEKYRTPGVLQQHYDVVVSYDVIEHVDDPARTFQQLTDLVNPDGLLIIGTPNADKISLSRVPRDIELSQPYHQHILSEQALRQLAARYGLTTEHIYRRFYFDTLVPGVNTRFMWNYIQASGGVLDVCVRPPNQKTIWRSPKLIFSAFFGYFYPPKGNILLTFRQASAHALEGSTTKKQANR